MLRIFAAQGQDGLDFGIATLLGGAAGRIAFHDESSGFRRILALAIRQFAWQGIVRKRALAPPKLLGAPGRFPGPGSVHGFFDNLPDIPRDFPQNRRLGVRMSAGPLCRQFRCCQARPLVCPSNWGWGSFTLQRQSGPPARHHR